MYTAEDGKKYNTFKVNFYGKTYELFFVKHQYADNRTLAIEAVDAQTEEPFGILTVNLRDPNQLRKNHAFFDINNYGILLAELESLGICKRANDGYHRQSGWVSFPLDEWDLDKFRVGGEPKTYFVEYFRYTPDGDVCGALDWHFEEMPETETEDLEKAKETAREAIEDFPYDKEDGVVAMVVIDEDNNHIYTVANCNEEEAKAYSELHADECADVTAEETVEEE